MRTPIIFIDGRLFILFFLKLQMHKLHNLQPSFHFYFQIEILCNILMFFFCFFLCLLIETHTQFTIRNGRGRFGIPGSDRKPLVLSTYLDAQEHLPYADDSNAVTPMSEENGAIIVPVYYTNMGKKYTFSIYHSFFL